MYEYCKEKFDVDQSYLAFKVTEEWILDVVQSALQWSQVLHEKKNKSSKNVNTVSYRRPRVWDIRLAGKEFKQTHLIKDDACGRRKENKIRTHDLCNSSKLLGL